MSTPELGELQRLAQSISEQLPVAASTITTMEPGNPVYAHRVAFDVSLALGDRQAEELTVLDLGGGIGLFSLVLARLGARSIIADDFGDAPAAYVEALRTTFDSFGVEVIEQDLLTEPLPLPDKSVDVVTNFHFLEHLHGSPRGLFHDAKRVLVDGGAFIVAGPNCVNLRKRLTVPLGRGKWSTFDSWYGETRFRGHVREPDVADLLAVTDDLGFAHREVHGRNFLGMARDDLVGKAARLVDPVLQRRPALCSDIYVVAT